MGKTIDIGGRIHNTEVGNVVTGANEILDDTKNKKQDVINSEVDAALEALDANKQDNLTFDQTPTESSTNPVTSGGVYAADLALQQAIEAILTLIPSAASALNQLADKSFVNSSIATASATFRGTYNLVSDLHLSVTASHQDIATALASAVSTADNNDYCFVQIPTSDTSSDIRVTERYKFNGTAWAYEYDLNNSGFTATQWEAINSGITALLVTKLGALPTAAELATSLARKQNVLTFDNVPVSGSDNPVKSGGLYQLFTAIDAKFPSDVSSSNKLVAENRLAAYVTAVIEALDASFDLTSADGHVTFRMTQTNGVIASVQILTSDIASDSDLTTLSGRVSTNETDIANLQAAYAGLTQSNIVVVNGALPTSGQQQNIIYRQPDQVNNPPQYYSDYMWNGSGWVLMAMYNNAIDAEPTAYSKNLVESGGVFRELKKIKEGIQLFTDNIEVYDVNGTFYVRRVNGVYGEIKPCVEGDVIDIMSQLTANGYNYAISFWSTEPSPSMSPMPAPTGFISGIKADAARSGKLSRYTLTAPAGTAYVAVSSGQSDGCGYILSDPNLEALNGAVNDIENQVEEIENKIQKQFSDRIECFKYQNQYYVKRQPNSYVGEIVQCSPGDIISIYAKMGNNGLNYVISFWSQEPTPQQAAQSTGFISGVMADAARDNVLAFYSAVAPSGTTYVIVSSVDNERAGYADGIVHDIIELQNDVEDMQSEIDELKETENSLFEERENSVLECQNINISLADLPVSADGIGIDSGFAYIDSNNNVKIA